jgi:hypothetical protein
MSVVLTESLHVTFIINNNTSVTVQEDFVEFPSVLRQKSIYQFGGILLPMIVKHFKNRQETEKPHGARTLFVMKHLGVIEHGASNSPSSRISGHRQQNETIVNDCMFEDERLWTEVHHYPYIVDDGKTSAEELVPFLQNDTSDTNFKRLFDEDDELQPCETHQRSNEDAAPSNSTVQEQQQSHENAAQLTHDDDDDKPPAPFNIQRGFTVAMNDFEFNISLWFLWLFGIKFYEGAPSLLDNTTSQGAAAELMQSLTGSSSSLVANHIAMSRRALSISKSPTNESDKLGRLKNSDDVRRFISKVRDIIKKNGGDVIIISEEELLKKIEDVKAKPQKEMRSRGTVALRKKI